MPAPIIAHAADYIALVPILVAVIALAVYTRRDNRRGDEDTDSMLGTAALGLRTVMDRYRKGSKDDKRKKS